MCTPITCITSGRPFGQDGCQVPVGNGICGEKRTLEFINEFKKLFAQKMEEIDAQGGGDCMQEKLRLQQEWIENLIEQNEMLLRAVGELEVEATERVHMLEEKLQRSAQCICEVMNKYRQYDVTSEILTEPLEKIFRLENDQKNLLEFIRRIREDRKWDFEGLSFFEISYKDLFGNDLIENYDKDRCLNNNDEKEEELLKNQECTIEELRKQIDHFNSFGNVEIISKDLKCKIEECESLRKSMIDMRQALTEEVASKHDTILQLKRDIHRLEEKCIQSDQQTAFKDELVKELRKEIKQLKQQLTQDEVLKLHSTISELERNLQRSKELQEEEEKTSRSEIFKLKETIETLKKNLKETEDRAKVCKICKGRAKVGFAHSTQVQATPDQEQIKTQMELLKHRDEIIKVQTETLSLLQNELQNLKQRDGEIRQENEKQYNEINLLRNRIKELENELNNSEEKGANLQLAVDLYLNTINVLEATEEKYKLEIDNQKVTISNLQSAFVTLKQELEGVKQKSDENESEQYKIINLFTSMMTDNETENVGLKEQIQYVANVYGQLQELNFELEMEHFTSLQDIEILDNQLYKYQMLLKSEEEESKYLKNQLKKLQKQKKCYEEVVAYFKDEIKIMADQLRSLQELLTISHASIQDENNKLQKAFLNVQSVNEQLSVQLKAAEKKILLEHQMNQLNESKIMELEKLISDKELDLGRHDHAILSIRQTLQYSLKQNEELHSTVVSLNGTIVKLQNAIKIYEDDNAQSKQYSVTCQEQINYCKTKLEELKETLERKTTELCKLEMAYNSQNRSLKSAQLELKEIKEKQREKQCNLRCILGEMEEKLKVSEEKYNKLMEDYKKLETKLGVLSRREQIKQVEIVRYRQIVTDLKKTLIDLNKNLTKKDYQPKCQSEACRRKFLTDSEEADEEVPISCPCEVEFYHSIVENLKKSVNDLQTKLNHSQKKNEELEEKCKCSEARVEEMSKTQMEKDKEYNELRQKLTEKLRLSQQEESRYLELAGQFERELGSIRQELEIRTLQLNDVKKSAQEINSSRCLQLACAQEEVNRLKEELNKLLRKHCSLNVENEKLHSQSAHLQSTVSTLEEKSQLMKSQLEQYLAELQIVQNEKETLVHKNRELLSELRSLQMSYATVNKQQRYNNESLKILESELSEMKSNRDDICFESKNVITYVRSWLQEQKKINEFVANRERNYCLTIEKLKQENQELQIHHPTQKAQQPCLPCQRMVPSPPPFCQSPWSLGSQGTSYSPSQSPCLNEECDWYSSNFRSYSTEEEEEDDWVSKVEDLAAQVRKTNKMWKNKLNGSENTVTKDTKK